MKIEYSNFIEKNFEKKKYVLEAKYVTLRFLHKQNGSD